MNKEIDYTLSSGDLVFFTHKAEPKTQEDWVEAEILDINWNLKAASIKLKDSSGIVTCSVNSLSRHRNIVYPLFSDAMMLYLGFEKVSENGPLKAFQNNATILWDKDYNAEFPEPKGKVIINVNTEYRKNKCFATIQNDGGTRKVYNGVVPNEEFLIQLLKNIR